MSDRLEELSPFPDHSVALKRLVGQSSGQPQLSPHAVNAPMIRHWVEAMGDTNPLYVSDESARSHGYDGVIAPPTMLQAWIMRGLRASWLADEARAAGEDPANGAHDSMMHLLDLEGLTSVVATNCEQSYGRPLVLGDRLLVRSVIEDISDPKRTGLGTGRFFTSRLDFTAVPDADVPEDPSPEEIVALAERGEPVATMHFRILKYLPPARRSAAGAAIDGSTGATAPPPSGADPGQRLLVRGRPGPPPPHSALHLVRDVAAPTPAGVRHLSIIRVGHRDGERSRHPVLLCRGALPPGTLVRVPTWPSGWSSWRKGRGSWPTLKASIAVTCTSVWRSRPRSSTTTMSSRSPSSGPPPHHLPPHHLPPTCHRTIWRDDLMDFAFTDEQHAVSEAAMGLLGGLVDAERILAVEQTDDMVDRELWAALSAADLLGLAVPEAHGGAGYGLTELCLLLQAQGNVVAPVPLWATLVLGALPLAQFGSPELQARWLPGVVAGDVMLTAALNGVAMGVHGVPPVTATAVGDGWVLNGTELAVPQAHLAQRIVVPAHTADEEIVLLLVDPQAPGVSLERTVTTNREIHPHLHLTDVAVPAGDVLVDPTSARAALETLVMAATAGLCALQVGVCESALRQTALYLNQRNQFGRPLSSFQGTMLRAADAAIDIEAMRVTLWNATWLFDTGRDATDAVQVAKWQASERGQRTVHATQHLHGGMGADITYPIHRYFLWGKQLELLLGGPSLQLARIGAGIAARALAEAKP